MVEATSDVFRLYIMVEEEILTLYFVMMIYIPFRGRHILLHIMVEQEIMTLCFVMMIYIPFRGRHIDIFYAIINYVLYCHN